MGNRRGAPQSFAAQIPSMESANRVEWVRGFLGPNVKNLTYFHDTIAMI